MSQNEKTDKIKVKQTTHLLDRYTYLNNDNPTVSWKKAIMNSGIFFRTSSPFSFA